MGKINMLEPGQSAPSRKRSKRALRKLPEVPEETEENKAMARRSIATETTTNLSPPDRFSIPNTLAESFIEFLVRPDGTVNVGALCSAMNSSPRDVFASDTAWVRISDVMAAMTSNKKLRPLRDAFGETVQSMQEIRGEIDTDDKENTIPYRCVDFLKSVYGHNLFDAVHLMTFGGMVYSEFIEKRGHPPPLRADGYKLYFTRDIPIMKSAFDKWNGKLPVKNELI
eukprot:jgi/Mesvir1/20405/Mv12309-RA.1